MKRLLTTLLLSVFIFSCQDSKMEPFNKKHASGEYPDKEIMAIDQHVQLKDGTLHFYSKESFDLITNYVLSSRVGREEFFSHFNNKGFEGVYKFYDNLP